MSGGGGGNTSTTVQKADPWAGAQPYLKDVYARAQRAANNTSTTPYSGNFTTQANGIQGSVVGDLLGLSQSAGMNGTNMNDLANKTINGDFLTGAPLQASLEANMRPIAERARDIMLPAVSSQAQSQGAYGGSRHALMQRYAFGDTERAIADATAKTLGENYGRERQYQTFGAPGLLQAGVQQLMMPTQLKGQAGDLQYSIDNLLTQNNLQKFEDSINAPWRAVNPYAAVLGGVGMPGGSSTSESTAPSGSRAAGMATGAMGGATMGLMATGGNPIGAIIGALLGGGLGMIR